MAGRCSATTRWPDGPARPRARRWNTRGAMGRNSFTNDEINELRRLIREKQTADRSRQKTLRARMRAIGFYISDFAADSAGFVVSDLDDLISRGVITVKHGGSRRATSPPTPAAKAGPLGRRRDVRPAPRADRAAPTPTGAAREGEDLDSVVHEALRALAAEHAQPIAKAADHIPRRPGLYAIHAAPKVWLELELGEPPDERRSTWGRQRRASSPATLTPISATAAPARRLCGVPSLGCSASRSGLRANRGTRRSRSALPTTGYRPYTTASSPAGCGTSSRSQFGRSPMTARSRSLTSSIVCSRRSCRHSTLPALSPRGLQRSRRRGR
jgi:hypothetical protein